MNNKYKNSFFMHIRSHVNCEKIYGETGTSLEHDKIVIHGKVVNGKDVPNFNNEIVPYHLVNDNVILIRHLMCAKTYIDNDHFRIVLTLP